MTERNGQGSARIAAARTVAVHIVVACIAAAYTAEQAAQAARAPSVNTGQWAGAAAMGRPAKISFC